MNTISLYSKALVGGLVTALRMVAVLPSLHAAMSLPLRLLSTVCLAFIMIGVGKEFQFNRGAGRSQAGDYGVAMLAAAVPWLLVALWAYATDLSVTLPADGHIPAWVAVLFVARFSAPTSAGVLFSMLHAAGLEKEWMYQKARVLAIFDDVDTILLLIPLQMLILGPRWQLGFILVATVGLLVFGWKYYRRINLPSGPFWLMAYAVLLTVGLEALAAGTAYLDSSLPVHVEVLLPAFVLGMIMRLDQPQRASASKLPFWVSLVFLALVGPALPTAALALNLADLPTYLGHATAFLVLGNLGKMAPAFFYRKEAKLNERLSLSVGMWPRGEVGAGVLAVAVSLGIGGQMVTIAALSLALNLALTGHFIGMARWLLRPTPLAFKPPDWAYRWRMPVIVAFFTVVLVAC